MDSTTLAYDLKAQGYSLILASVDYGQRHRRAELTKAKATAEKLDAEHLICDLTSLRTLLSGSALTDDIEVPEGHYAADSMSLTVVPNRNMIMLSVAGGIAVARDAQIVATAVHAGDHPIYPDCRPEFIEAVSAALKAGTAGQGHPDLDIVAPYVTIDKTEIARIGDSLGVPWAETWSCYKGGDVHCGRCGTCVERIEALWSAGVDDPTTYLDAEFANTVLSR